MSVTPNDFRVRAPLATLLSAAALASLPELGSRSAADRPCKHSSPEFAAKVKRRRLSNKRARAERKRQRGGS